LPELDVAGLRGRRDNALRNERSAALLPGRQTSYKRDRTDIQAEGDGLPMTEPCMKAW
jgi:hypothetical protein